MMKEIEKFFDDIISCALLGNYNDIIICLNNYDEINFSSLNLSQDEAKIVKEKAKNVSKILQASIAGFRVGKYKLDEIISAKNMNFYNKSGTKISVSYNKNMNIKL